MSRMQTTRTDRLKTGILLLAVAGLTSGLAFYFAGRTDIADLVWIATALALAAALAASAGPPAAANAPRPAGGEEPASPRIA